MSLNKNTPPITFFSKRCPECEKGLAVSSTQGRITCSFCNTSFRVLHTLSHGVKLEKI